MGGNFSQYLQSWVVLFCGVFFIFPVCLGFLYFNALGHLSCFRFSLNTFSCRLLSILSSRYLLHFKQIQIYGLEEVLQPQKLVGLKFLKEYPASTIAGAKMLQPCHSAGQITPSYVPGY